MKVAELMKDGKALGVELIDAEKLLQQLLNWQTLLKLHEAWDQVEDEWNELVTAVKTVLSDLT